MRTKRFSLEFFPFDMEKDTTYLVHLLSEGHSFVAHEGGLNFPLIREYETERQNGQTVVRFVDDRGYTVWPSHIEAYAEVPRRLES